ncbi:uncharacterized protein B0I36DRAFT_133664 [Microdochium trichocladiopsis]|uniref:Uncharacterized protein n=1 Tax=Microdochium trichocladiopsis TaxID=1682393 RepID=A0A9P8Y315_9PEZI|nr:uncharacterized protein B0I36DRAFT_133664 [Microdochium trichocladiopsis]KAH7029549.1 hypothetical protein B0I36DRAFT_133664 [Microdochium trichocladiopsis]
MHDGRDAGGKSNTEMGERARPVFPVYSRQIWSAEMHSRRDGPNARRLFGEPQLDLQRRTRARASSKGPFRQVAFPISQNLAIFSCPEPSQAHQSRTRGGLHKGLFFLASWAPRRKKIGESAPLGMKTEESQNRNRAAKKKHLSSSPFRSEDLRVMSPARFPCAKLLLNRFRRLLNSTVLIVACVGACCKNNVCGVCGEV